MNVKAKVEISYFPIFRPHFCETKTLNRFDKIRNDIFWHLIQQELFFKI